MQAYLQGIVAEEVLSVKDATFANDPYISLNAPVTEFAFWEVKNGANIVPVRDKLDQLVRDVTALDPAGTVAKSGRGVIAQSEKEFCVMFGWTSLEVCYEPL